MARSFDHFIAHTNVDMPIIVSTEQRRAMVMTCDHSFNMLLANPQRREAYLARLASVLDNEQMWRALAFKLWSEYVPNDEVAKRKLAWIRTKRTFSPETTKIQLVSMIYYPDKNVLGYLFINLARRTPLSQRPTAFILEPVNSERKPSFTKWDSWCAINASAVRKPELKGFETMSWKKDKDSSRWWHKERRFVVYKDYQASMRQYRNAAELAEPEFWSEMERILCYTDAIVTEPAMMRDTDVGKENAIEEWVAFAPFERLRAAVERAIPSGLGFTWAQWDELHH